MESKVDHIQVAADFEEAGWVADFPRRLNASALHMRMMVSVMFCLRSDISIFSDRSFVHPNRHRGLAAIAPQKVGDEGERFPCVWHVRNDLHRPAKQVRVKGFCEVELVSSWVVKISTSGWSMLSRQ